MSKKNRHIGSFKWDDDDALLALRHVKMAMGRVEDLPEGTDFYEDKKTDTQFFLFHSDDFITCTFRATESSKWKDIKRDLKFWKVKASEQGHRFGKVHRGFKGGVMSVWPGKILEKIYVALDEGRGIRIHGHSLGASEGAYLAWDLAHVHGIRANEVYLFGSPRLGNGKFANAYNDLLYNVTFNVWNYRDPIPTMPFAHWNFRHFGRIVYYDKCGNQHLSPKRSFVFKNRLFSSFRDSCLEKKSSDLMGYHGSRMYEEVIMDSAEESSGCA